MQRSLYEMDIENSIALAKEQGLSQGKAAGIKEGRAAGIEEGLNRGLKKGLNQGKAAAEYEERVAMVRGLLDIGQQHDQIINFLVKTRNLTTKQAESYYQAAIK
ncbi:hypothetical protein [Limosilactobacillus caccae]|uniref:hypothetical protein n=1 Tax=Limosilactobacillus caccae TaxID=1926284 RepID=UPI000971244E|nr:hypothetical protein [Limosilactobacillus caccae]